LSKKRERERKNKIKVSERKKMILQNLRAQKHMLLTYSQTSFRHPDPTNLSYQHENTKPTC